MYCSLYSGCCSRTFADYFLDEEDLEQLKHVSPAGLERYQLFFFFFKKTRTIFIIVRAFNRHKFLFLKSEVEAAAIKKHGKDGIETLRERKSEKKQKRKQAKVHCMFYSSW
jgi:hypothetical protein